MNIHRSDVGQLTIVAPAAMTAGVPYLLGLRLVVPASDAASGEVVTVYTEGQFTLSKVSGAISGTVHAAAETLALGDLVFWDAINSVVTLKPMGAQIGEVVTAAGSSATTVRVALNHGILGSRRTFVGYLDATDGKATGTHELAMFGPDIPLGWKPVSFHYHVMTTFTSATDAGTIALGVKTDSEACLKAAVAISNGANPWDSGQFSSVAPAAGAKTTAARKLVAVVAVEALTAGKMAVYAECERVI